MPGLEGTGTYGNGPMTGGRRPHYISEIKFTSNVSIEWVN